jgi:hypothetical protein
MAPEQAQAREVGPETDFYALGVNLYEMLSGHLPFYSETPVGILLKHLQQKPPSLQGHVDAHLLPQAIVDLCMRLLKKEMKNRPADTRELRALIQATREALGMPQPVALTTDARTAFDRYILPPLTNDPGVDATSTDIYFRPSEDDVDEADEAPKQEAVDPEEGIATNRLPAVTSPPAADKPAPSPNDAGARAWAAFSEAAESAPEPRQPELLDPNLWAAEAGMSGFSNQSIEFDIPVSLYTVEPQDTGPMQRPSAPDTSVPGYSEASAASPADASREDGRPEWLQTARDSMEYELADIDPMPKPAPQPPPTRPAQPELRKARTGTDALFSNLIYIVLIVGLVAGVAYVGMQLFFDKKPAATFRPEAAKYEHDDYAGYEAYADEESDAGTESDDGIDRKPPTTIRRARDRDRAKKAADKLGEGWRKPIDLFEKGEKQAEQELKKLD